MVLILREVSGLLVEVEVLDGIQVQEMDLMEVLEEIVQVLSHRMLEQAKAELLIQAVQHLKEKEDTLAKTLVLVVGEDRGLVDHLHLVFEVVPVVPELSSSHILHKYLKT
jgi:hypothetical protein